MPPKKGLLTPKNRINTRPLKIAINSTATGRVSKRPRMSGSKVQNNMDSDFIDDLDQELSVSLIRSLFQNNAREISEKIDNRFDALVSSLSAQDVKIKSLESEVISLKDTVLKVSAENESLWCEINKLNLVFKGISDVDNETSDQLLKTVSDLLKLMGLSFGFDTAVRIGKFSPSFPRLVKVRFLCVSDREAVYSSRFSAPKPIYINADFPVTMRRDHAIMRQKKKDLISEGYQPKQIRFDWNRKLIRTEDCAFKVADGALVDSSERLLSQPHPRPLSNNSDANPGGSGAHRIGHLTQAGGSNISSNKSQGISNNYRSNGYRGRGNGSLNWSGDRRIQSSGFANVQTLSSSSSQHIPQSNQASGNHHPNLYPR